MVCDIETSVFLPFYSFETNYWVKVVEGNVEGLGVSLEESWVSPIGVIRVLSSNVRMMSWFHVEIAQTVVLSSVLNGV